MERRVLRHEMKPTPCRENFGQKASGCEATADGARKSAPSPERPPITRNMRALGKNRGELSYRIWGRGEKVRRPV